MKGMVGKHHSEATKEKIANALRGRRREGGWKLTEETRKKQSLARIGKPLSEETKRKLSFALKGRPLKEETKIKMGLSRTGDKNPAWCGGVSFLPYCQKFNDKFKKRVKDYYHNCCGICGSVGRLHIHHVDYNKMTCCDGTKPRFIALCNVCHGKTNHNRDYWRERLGSEFRLFTP
jgi:hypothetical protein